MIENGDAREGDHSIEVSAAVVSKQWTKKDEGSLETFQQLINNKKHLDGR